MTVQQYGVLTDLNCEAKAKIAGTSHLTTSRLSSH
jgi:hypothetical protein